MRKLFGLIFFISILVVVAYASDISDDKHCSLALYIIKNSDMDQISYKLIDKEQSGSRPLSPRRAGARCFQGGGKMHIGFIRVDPRNPR
jgi:hypothetical protein